MFPTENFKFEGVAPLSGISDQPMNTKETLFGAKNRVQNAYKFNKAADFWVGIEGGVEEIYNEYEAFAWVVISDNKKEGKARTGTFFIPEKVAALVKTGKELGQADDIVFGLVDSKLDNGAVGILTRNATDRTKYYSEAVVLALIPFLNPELY